MILPFKKKIKKELLKQNYACKQALLRVPKCHTNSNKPGCDPLNEMGYHMSEGRFRVKVKCTCSGKLNHV